jgi:hypothetical protein
MPWIFPEVEFRIEFDPRKRVRVREYFPPEAADRLSPIFAMNDHAVQSKPRVPLKPFSFIIDSPAAPAGEPPEDKPLASRLGIAHFDQRRVVDDIAIAL